MVIAKLQGERDEVRFQAVLNDPSPADRDRVDDEPEPSLADDTPPVAPQRRRSPFPPDGARDPGLRGKRGRRVLDPAPPSLRGVYGCVVDSVNVSVLA
jgi:hypothetical protein